MADANAKQNREWIYGVLRPLGPMYREVVVSSLFVNMLALAVPVFTMQVYDRVIFTAGLTTLQGLSIGMLVVLAFDFFLRQTRSRIMQRAALRIDVTVGQRMFNKVMALPLTELEGKQAAFWQATFRDVETVRNTLSGPSALLLVDLPFAVLFLGLIILIAQPVAWTLAVILPAFVFLAWRSASDLGTSAAAEKESGYGRDVMLAEIIAGRTTVKALALDDDIRPLWESKQADSIKKSVTRGGKADTYQNYGAELATFSTIAMTTVGALAIIDLNLTMGALISANMLTGRILGPFNQLVGSWRTFSSFLQAVERLGGVLAMPEERQEIAIKLDRPRGHVTFDQISFSYGPNSPKVLDGVRLHIEPGKLIAIVGANGSGKTTLVKVLQGLYRPSTGRVLLDGADINQFTRRELASWMGYVPQDAFLFSTTIRDNIVKGHADATDEQIVAAAKLSGLHDFVIDYPDGYGTNIGEGGRTLSGGLRQRLTITRALLGDPPILILDEPSSNLDRDGETELVSTLKNLANDHTVIVISHSPSLLSSCDLVLVMQKGRVVRSGRPDDVLPPQMLARPLQVVPQIRNLKDAIPESQSLETQRPTPAEGYRSSI